MLEMLSNPGLDCFYFWKLIRLLSRKTYMLQLCFVIASSRELLRRQIELITSSQSSILSSGREVNNLSYESAGFASARRVDPHRLYHIRLYRRKHSARLKSSPFQCGPPAVEPRSITSPPLASLIVNLQVQKVMLLLLVPQQFLRVFDRISTNLWISFLIHFHYLCFQILILIMMVIVMLIPLLNIFLIPR